MEGGGALRAVRGGGFPGLEVLTSAHGAIHDCRFDRHAKETLNDGDFFCPDANKTKPPLTITGNSQWSRDRLTRMRFYCNWKLTGSAWIPSCATSSSCVPVSATWPSLNTNILSAYITVASLWATTTAVFPCLAWSSDRCTSCSDCVSSAAVTSSGSIAETPCQMAVEMQIRCFCPLERDVWCTFVP